MSLRYLHKKEHNCDLLFAFIDKRDLNVSCYERNECLPLIHLSQIDSSRESIFILGVSD